MRTASSGEGRANIGERGQADWRRASVNDVGQRNVSDWPGVRLRHLVAALASEATARARDRRESRWRRATATGAASGAGRRPSCRSHSAVQMATSATARPTSPRPVTHSRCARAADRGVAIGWRRPEHAGVTAGRELAEDGQPQAEVAFDHEVRDLARHGIEGRRTYAQPGGRGGGTCDVDAVTVGAIARTAELE